MSFKSREGPSKTYLSFLLQCKVLRNIIYVSFKQVDDHRVSGIESHIWKCPWNLLVGLSLVDVFHRWRAVLSEARRFMDTGPVQKGRVALCKHYLAPLWEIHDSSVGG